MKSPKAKKDWMGSDGRFFVMLFMFTSREELSGFQINVAYHLQMQQFYDEQQRHIFE
jgi:hypothetical protein